MTAGDRRSQILNATAGLVAEGGFHGLSIEAVAQRAGISRPIVYEHFGDLSGLIEALIADTKARGLAQLAQVLQRLGPTQDVVAGLTTALDAYLEVVAADPDTWRMILIPPEGAPARFREAVAQGRAAVVAELAQTVNLAGASGLDSPDPALTARVLSVLADESARLVLTEPAEFPRERILGHARWLMERVAG